jgi:hypothetical protein
MPYFVTDSQKSVAVLQCSQPNLDLFGDQSTRCRRWNESGWCSHASHICVACVAQILLSTGVTAVAFGPL